MKIAPSHQKARLADHVRACVVGDQMIFLDLLRGKYVGASGPQLHALSAFILDGTSFDQVPASDLSSELFDEWVRRLRAQQLLSDSPRRATPTRPALPEAVASLDMDEEQSAAPDWRQLPRLWRSTWITSVWLRRSSLAEIADRVVSLRARHSGRGAVVDAEDMRAAVGAYMRLRPFALTTHDRCLNDSVTLVHFLASQGLFPEWVIGVRVHPFGAHSWVQAGGVVLNDLPERVRAYRPILIV